MGYTITIGELSIEKSPEDGLDCTCLSLGAEGQSHDTGPAFGEPTDLTNERWPSYSSWSNFLRDSGLYDVFFYSDGNLVGGHPGIRLITKEMKDRVDLAMINFKAANPNVEAKFVDGESEGGTLCRLTWLKYWIDWAIVSCDTPVIANS